MQCLMSLNKFLLRRSTERGCGSSSYAALLRSSPLQLEPAATPFSSKCYHQQRWAWTSNFSYEVLSCAFVLRQIVGRRTYFSAAGFRSQLAVESQSVKFSVFERKGFGARQPYGSWRSYWRYMPTSDEVVLGLIGANVAVYFLWRFTDLSFMRKHFMISLENVKNGHLHTILTSAFSHADLDHLVTNMIGLYFFGTSISRLFGPAFLLKLYVAGALGGSVFFLLHRIYIESTQRYHRRAEALGASAAVNAIILLDVFLFPKNIYYVNLVIPLPAVLMGAFIIGSDLWRIKKGDDQISGSAHMGGAFVALLAWAAVKRGLF